MVRSSWFRLQALLLALLLVGGTSAATLAQDATPPAGGADLSGELTLWHGFTGAEADTLNDDIIPAWEAAFPNVSLEVLAVPFDQLKDKYSNEVAAGGGPDVVIGALDWVGELAEGELIMPLDDLATEEVLADYVPTTVDALRLEDRLYALPESFETVALYYNRDLVETPPATTDELKQQAAELAGQDQYGFALYSNFYHPAGYFFGHGAQLFTDDNLSAIASPDTAEFLTFLRDLTASPGVFQQNDDAAISSLFKEGKAAMIINGPWALGDYQGALGEDKVGVAPLPMISGRDDAPAQPFLGVKNLMINANLDDEQARLAFEFSRWFTSPEAETFLVEKAGHLAAHTGVDVSGNETAQAFIEQAKTAVPLPSIPEMQFVWEPAGNMITKVIEGQAEPQAAAEEAQEQINQQIEGSS